MGELGFKRYENNEILVDKNNIVEDVKKDSLVERAVYKLLPSSKNPFDFPEDLIQDIYVILLDMDDSMLEGLYIRKELPFYIIRITRNQLLSKNSRYYYNYIKFRKDSEDIQEYKDTIAEDRGRIY